MYGPSSILTEEQPYPLEETQIRSDILKPIAQNQSAGELNLA